MGGGAAAAVVLVLLLSAGNTFTVYSFGEPCESDCGGYAANALRCMEGKDGAAFCSRPCGELHPECPTGFECRPLLRASAAGDHRDGTARDTYCAVAGQHWTMDEHSGRTAYSASLSGQPHAAVTYVSFEAETVHLPTHPVITMQPPVISSESVR